MSGQFDLDVDTAWIRRAAEELDGTARDFLPADHAGQRVLATHLGGSAQAEAAAVLVNLRMEQAQDAAAQLSSIAAGLAANLRVVADTLERAETLTGAR